MYGFLIYGYYGICIEDAKFELQRFNAKIELLDVDLKSITKPSASDIDAYYDGLKALQDGYNGISDKKLCVAMIQAAGDKRTARQECQTKAQKQQQIAVLKQQLAAMDYKGQKYIDGEYSPEQWALIVAERKAVRVQIRELEG